MRIPMMAGALLALTTTAAAAGPPTIQTGQVVTLDLASPGSLTWRVYLHGGHDYAFGATIEGDSETRVTAPDGRVVATVQGTRDDDGVSPGASFRAAASGAYFVTVRLRSTAYGDGKGGFVMDRDCAGNASTACGLPVGGTFANAAMSYQDDLDDLRTSLRAQRSYYVEVTGVEHWFASCAYAVVVNAGGGVVAVVGRAGAFSVPKDGTYYVQAQDGCELPGHYSISLR